MATVQIPAPLRRLTNGDASVTVPGATVREVLDALETRHPGILARICDDAGAVRRFVNIYKSDRDIRDLDGLDTGLADSDELAIVPAMAGGRGGCGCDSV